MNHRDWRRQRTERLQDLSWHIWAFSVITILNKPLPISNLNQMLIVGKIDGQSNDFHSNVLLVCYCSFVCSFMVVRILAVVE